MAESDLPDFRFDPDKGAYLASFGPKGTGKSELGRRLFRSYPYNGLLVDLTKDVDPEHRFTEPITAELRALARELATMEDVDVDQLGAFQARVRQAWLGEPPRRFRKYRVVPSFIAKDWLDRSDDFVGLAYLLGLCVVMLDEVNDEAPAGRTPRWTRQMLRVGRHERCSMLMAGPRPADLDPLVLNQADVVTVHGQLHELDVDRMARQLHVNTRELLGLVDNLQPAGPDVDYGEFLAYFKRHRELVIFPPLPPEHRRDLRREKEPRPTPPV